MGERAPGGSIETGNRLGQRPVVRQSRLYREHESGNRMKAMLGHDDLTWDTDQQQGAFAGRPVFNAETERYERQPAAARAASSRERRSIAGASSTPSSAAERSAAPRQSPRTQSAGFQAQWDAQTGEPVWGGGVDAGGVDAMAARQAAASREHASAHEAAEAERQRLAALMPSTLRALEDSNDDLLIQRLSHHTEASSPPSQAKGEMLLACC